MRKRILSVILVLALCFAYLPAVPKASAADYHVSSVDDLDRTFGDGDFIILDGSINAPAFDLDLDSISTNSAITIDLNGYSLTLNSISISEGSLSIEDTSGGTPGTLTAGSIAHVPAGANEAIFSLNNGVTVAVNSFTWVSDGISAQVTENSVLDLKGDVTLGFISDASDMGFWIDDMNIDSKAIIEHPDRIYGYTAADATELAAWFETHLPGHFNAASTGLAVNLTNSLPDGTTPAVTGTLPLLPVTAYVEATIETPPEPQALPYNAAPQALFTAGTTEEGTIWYTTDNGTTWTSTIPTGTDVADSTTTAGYMIAGDATHEDSTPVINLTAEITPAPVTITPPRKGVSIADIAAYDTFADTVISGLQGTDTAGSLDFEYAMGLATETTTAALTEGTWEVRASNLVLSSGDLANYNVSYTVYGNLSVTALPPVIMTAAPEIVDGLVYNGGEQALITPGTAQYGTFVYSTDSGTTWNAEVPAKTDADSYEVLSRIEPDTGYAEVDAYDSEIIVEIQPAPAVLINTVNITMYPDEALPVSKLYTIDGALYGNDEASLTIEPLWVDAENPDTGSVVVGQTYEYLLYVDATAISSNYADITSSSTHGSVTVINRPSGGPSDDKVSYDFSQPEDGPGSGKVTDTLWKWGDRANLPKDDATLYMVLANNGISENEDTDLPYPSLGTEYFLASDKTWELPEENPDVPETPIIEVRVCQDNEPRYLANGDGKVDQSTFGNSDFYTVGVGTGDTKIDYANLKTGDVVSNTSFNGVFVTKLQKTNNPTFDADLTKLKSDTIASFRAFELDHPEVFWLNGSIKLRVLTVTLGGEQTSFIFMTLVDDGGFTMRIADYAEKGAIEKGITARDAAIDAIIAQIPAGASDRDKVVNLNKWFTMNNEYNRSADLSSIGFTPHRSLKSLTGNFGINGPVCDGYSRGFKTVCDRLGIPVVLETGTASIGSHSELHMWMSIKIDGTWYGTDTTWNDPIVKGKDGKVSGYENEKYLLVGNDTVVDGAKFGVSHPANKTPGGTTGVLFATLILNPNEIYGYTAIDYDDVKSTDWFFDYVQDVSARGLMNGTSPNLFSPQGTATRGQIVQILYNIAGQPEVEDVKVEGWFGVPATWAMDKGIVAGYPDGDFHGNDPVTREQLATILWAFEGAPEQSGELSFADADKVSSYAVNAMLWAKKEGLIGGKPGNLADPQGTATRAEIATIFSNYMK